MEPHVLYLYDYLDAGEAQRVGRQLSDWYPPDAQALRPLQVRIHSPGGEVFSGFAIYHQLLALRTRGVSVETVIDGLAASMASVVAMAGAPVSMAANAQLMIHNPWTTAQGDGETLRQTAEELDRLKQRLLEVYAHKSGRPPAELVEPMDAETYFDAEQARALGLVDQVVAAVVARHPPALPGSATQRLASLEAQLAAARDRLERLEAHLARLKATPEPDPTLSLTERLQPRAVATSLIPQARRLWSMRDWERLDPTGLARLRDQDPDAYRRLFAATYHPHRALNHLHPNHPPYAR